MPDQLILTDELLRVIGAILPSGRMAREISAARDVAGGGELMRRDLHLIEDALTAAPSDPWCLVAGDVLAGALVLWRRAVEPLSPAYDPRELVSVHVWEQRRDGEPPCIAASRLPEFPSAGRWAV